MRNFNFKNHAKPTTQNSFRKDDRVYPQKKKIQKGQSLPKKLTLQQRKVTSTQQIQYKTILPIQSHNQNSIIERYYLSLQDPYPITDHKSNQQKNDIYCLWFKNLQKNPTNKKRTIKLSKVNYLIPDWAEDKYPQILFLTIDGIFGYLDQHSVPTTKVVAMKLTEMNKSAQNPITFDLIYRSDKQITWEIPESLTHINLGLQNQYSERIPLPLPDAITLELEINNDA